MTFRVLIGSKSFGRANPQHLQQLRDGGCQVIPNAHGRAYRADELRDALRDVDAIVTGTDELTGDVIRGAERLVTIAKHGVGLDTIDLAAAREQGVIVSYTPGSMHDAVADHALALLLALVRHVPAGDRAVRGGGWSIPPGIELAGTTLGIVGIGRIGQAVARRAAAFGMRIVAHDPYPDTVWAADNDVELLSLDELLARADVVTLHAAAGGEVLLTRERLFTLRPGARLVNTARGSLVDETALADALASGHLAGAALDVFADEPPRPTSPLLGLDNVVLTPHVAGLTADALVRMGDQCVENVLRALRGVAPRFVAEPTD